MADESTERYKESDTHIPRPTDQVAFLNTTGIGGSHQRLEEIAPVFEQDKVAVAREIVAALDPDDTSVSSDRVMLPEANVVVREDDAAESLKARAEAKIEAGATIEPTPAQVEAAKEGGEGQEAAVRDEQRNAIVGGDPANTSPTGDPGDGETGPGGKNDADTGDAGPSNDPTANQDDDSKEAEKARKAAAKKAASSSSS